jgi:hypothetical protein
LREDVPDGVGKSFELHPSIRSSGIDDIVKNEMALIKSIVCSGELNRATAVLLDEL